MKWTIYVENGWTKPCEWATSSCLLKKIGVAVSCDYRICLDLMIVESTNSITKWNDNIHIIIITNAMFCAKLLHLLEQNWRNASPSFPTSENQFHRWLSCVRCLVLQHEKAMAMPTISKYQRMDVATYHHINVVVISSFL